jgi:ion channel POLLUX/CASTOR
MGHRSGADPLTRLSERLQFWLERRLVRGAHYRLLFVAMLIGLLSIIGGGLVAAFGSGFDSVGDAVWWAFLRLSDPGYLGDDEGTFNRVVSTALTVLGYVVFLGSLVAIMTQWLNARLTRLERGLTPVARRHHIVVLGWTNRTRAIVRELLLSENRVRRFLRLRGARSLHLVVLAGEVTPHLVQDLRDSAGSRWDERLVTLRSGSALRPEHLARVDAGNAAAVIVPAAESGIGAERADSHTVKALLSLDRMAGGRAGPFVVTEVFQTTSIELARQAYRGELEVLASNAFVSRLLAQNIRHPGLSAVYNELLSNEVGNEIYIRDAGALAGSTVAGARPRLPKAILLGIVRPADGGFAPLLGPRPDVVLQPHDRLVLMAATHDDTDPAAAGAQAAADAGRAGGAASPPRRPVAAASPAPAAPRRVLLLGWNHKVPALMEELATYVDERFEVSIVSSLGIAPRQRALGPQPDARVVVTHIEASFTHAADLAAVAPHAFDAIVLLGSDRFQAPEESDARTLMGFLVLQRLLGQGPRPPVLVELLDAENVALLGRSGAEVMISPMIISHMLAHIALRRELRVVFDELFTAGGAEVDFRPAGDYAPTGDVVSFAALERAALGRGETALGVRLRDGDARVLLNPERGRAWTVDEALDLIVLTGDG